MSPAISLRRAGQNHAKEKPDGKTIAYSYDERSRLVRVAYADGGTKKYTHDLAGRLVKLATGKSVESRTYDVRGLLSSVADQNGKQIKYEYDLLGNRVRMAGHVAPPPAKSMTPPTG